MYSPLEQFTVISLYSLQIGFIDISLTNSAIYCLLTIGCIGAIWSTLFLDGGLIIPSRYQVVSEMLYEFVSGLVLEQLGSYEARKYIGIVFTTWLFIFTANLLGLIPFSFATTAQLVVAFGLSFSLFIGVTLIGVFKHGLSFLSFFFTGRGTNWARAPAGCNRTY